MSDFYDPESITMFTDFPPDTLEELTNMLYILNKNSANIMQVMGDWIYTTKSYIEFKTPTVYENQNYNSLSGDTYRIPSMNYTVNALKDILYKEPLIKSEFNTDTFKQFKIRCTNTSVKDNLISYFKELSSDSGNSTIGLADAEIEEMIIYDIDDTKYYPITDNYQFGSGMLGFVRDSDYTESIKFNQLYIDYGRSLILKGSRYNELIGNETVTIDKSYIYNIVKSGERNIFDNLLMSTDITDDTDAIDGGDSYNDDISNLVNNKNYRIYALLIKTATDDFKLRYRLVEDKVFNNTTDDYNAIVNNKTDYYSYYNDYDQLSPYLDSDSIFGIGLIGGFHYGYNRNVRTKSTYINAVGNIQNETITVPSDDTKTISVVEYPKTIFTNVVENGVWDVYNRPLSCPVNMVSLGDYWMDIYCSDKTYLPTITNSTEFTNALTISNSASDINIDLSKNLLDNKSVIVGSDIFDINLGMYVYENNDLVAQGYDNVNSNYVYYSGSDTNPQYMTSANNVYTYLGRYLTLIDQISISADNVFRIGYGYTYGVGNAFSINFSLIDSAGKASSTAVRLKSPTFK